MTAIAASSEERERLQRLSQYLDADPTNGSLLAEVVELALACDLPHVGLAALERTGSARELDDSEVHLLARCEMTAGDFSRSAAICEALLASGTRAPGINFNLAWSKVMLGDKAAALTALEQGSIEALPDAARLHVQLLHDIGDLDAAMAAAKIALDRFPDHPALLATVSVLALDMEQEELAARCAAAAGDSTEALTTRATLALAENRNEDALRLFEQALALNPTAPRTLVGAGLARLLTGEAAAAAQALDSGAAGFGSHLGSWIVAGWAHVVAGDLATARSRFTAAESLDPNFAEVHGSLAALDCLTGQPKEAGRRIQVALRLDRECFSAALAQVLVSSTEGRHDVARRIFDKAINVSIDGSDRTIGQALSRMALL